MRIGYLFPFVIFLVAVGLLAWFIIGGYYAPTN
ncbi:TPA: YoaK family small membrane protein [Enterobacter cloacae]|nr:YoaK family small membrane protein [Enterobacter cloacae]MCU6309639.1 YoaK family small membrane protein [Enterobacter cloacae]HBL5000100.1 YoaK family small membrane protein [Enterobacter cloacae]HDC4405436.1 YoaK family small membrane protein [Enterobacter cloacae]HDC4600441.1 YoaK family small membrane protein [Enterobacter cloacae]